MIRKADWKLVYVPRPNGPEYRLYDLQADPGETRNVVREHPAKAEELRALLRGILDTDEDASTHTRALTDQEAEQLRKLGYM